MHFIICLVALVTLSCTHAFPYKNPNTVPGRSVMVHLFEWKWTDIADECERFLGPKGFASVQVSPPNEHAIIQGPGEPFRPWYERYQPVSYKLESRSGSELEFADMVRRCNAVGVRIYVDAIINHMSSRSGRGSNGTEFDSSKLHFPTVPYTTADFNDYKCPGGEMDYNDEYKVRNCRLVGLPDLAVERAGVRYTIVSYLNKLIDYGVAGFRIDAAKHMWPGELRDILTGLKNLDESVFGKDKQPYIYLEIVNLGSEKVDKVTEYVKLGVVTEFKYGMKLTEVINKENDQKLKYLRNFGSDWSFIHNDVSLVFVDNHDKQRETPLHVLTYKNSRQYKIANTFMLAWPYGSPQIMSSFQFEKSNQTPPCFENGNTKSPVIKPDQSCDSEWVCEHRWREITNMVAFRNTAGSEPVANWWDNWSNQIAFSRGNKAFVAINNDYTDMDVKLQTGLPEGAYCDVVSGDKVSDQSCSGRIVTVDSDGKAEIYIRHTDEDPMLALHVGAKLAFVGSNDNVNADAFAKHPNDDLKRTTKIDEL